LMDIKIELIILTTEQIDCRYEKNKVCRN
jgi:hypothetical protein